MAGHDIDTDAVSPRLEDLELRLKQLESLAREAQPSAELEPSIAESLQDLNETLSSDGAPMDGLVPFNDTVLSTADAPDERLRFLLQQLSDAVGTETPGVKADALERLIADVGWALREIPNASQTDLALLVHELSQITSNWPIEQRPLLEDLLWTVGRGINAWPEPPASPLVLESLHTLSDAFISLGVSCLVMAVLVVIAVETFKAATKGTFHKAWTRRWLERLTWRTLRDLRILTERSLPSPDGSSSDIDMELLERASREVAKIESEDFGISNLFDYPSVVFRAPRRLLMRRIESSAQQALADPHQLSGNFMVIADGSSLNDRLLVMDWARELPSKPESVPAHVRSAIDNVSAAVERNLDTLQLEMSQLWIQWVRGTALVSGIVGISLVSGEVLFQDTDEGQLGLSFLFLILLGVVSGYAATVVYDIFSRLKGSREET